MGVGIAMLSGNPISDGDTDIGNIFQDTTKYSVYCLVTRPIKDL